MMMANQPQPPDLATLLDRFAVRVNGQSDLRRTLAGWEPEFFIQARDTGTTYQVVIAGGRIERVVPVAAEPGDDALVLRADQSTLQAIFDGAVSPLGAYTDGSLEVYGSQKDQIKLDVVAVVLWVG
jgi:hypothetical protein